MDWIDSIQAVLGAIIVIAVVAASVFRYGNRAGLWFSELLSADRKLFWAAIGMACWTVVVAVGAWSVSFLAYVVRFADGPTGFEGWAAAASLGLIGVSVAVVTLAGLPWLVFLGIVRVIRWRGRRSADSTRL